MFIMITYILQIKHLNNSQRLQKMIKNLIDDGYIMFRLPEEYMNDVEICREYTHKHFINTGHQRKWDIINEISFHKLISYPIIKNILDSIYGEQNYHLTSYSTNTISSNVKPYFHVDHPFSEIDCTYSDKPKSIQVNITLDDFNEENGATMFIPNSHKLGHRPENFDDYKQFLCKKGTVLMYVGNLWHSTGINKTNQPRSTILSNFSSLDFVALKMKYNTDMSITEQIMTDNALFKINNNKVVFM